MAEQNLQDPRDGRGIRIIPRGLQFGLCITALAWAGAARVIAEKAAQGIAGKLQLGAAEELLGALFLLFLIVVGLKALDRVTARGWLRADVLALPARAGSRGEFAVGAALGWGLCVAAVLPVLLSLHLHSTLAVRWSTLGSVLISLATLLAGTLAAETIFRGYAFQRLIVAVGPSWASVLLALGYGVTLVVVNPPRHAGLALLNGALFGLLLSMAWLRTHALWLGWGLHFAYRAVTAVVLGLPIAGHGEFGALIDSYTTGPRWLTGGAFGLDAALLTSLVMLAGMVVLYRATRDYAWKYTFREIIPAGYEVTVAPPPAHVAMEQAAAPPPLVQILGSTPQTRSRIEPVAVNAAGNLLPPHP